MTFCTSATATPPVCGVTTAYFRSALDGQTLVEYENGELRKEYIYLDGLT